MRLRYGMNPHQRVTEALPAAGDQMPLDVLNGEPS